MLINDTRTKIESFQSLPLTFNQLFTKDIMMTSWEYSQKENILKTPVFSIIKKKSTNPRNSKEADFYSFDFPDWVNIIAITKDEEIIIIKQLRHGSEQVEIEIPGGVIDPEDTSPASAGERELLEDRQKN